MPRTKHAFCICHIITKFTDSFSMLLGSKYDEWKADFRQLYDLHSVEDFEAEWREMVDKCGLAHYQLVYITYRLGYPVLEMLLICGNDKYIPVRVDKFFYPTAYECSVSWR